MPLRLRTVLQELFSWFSLTNCRGNMNVFFLGFRDRLFSEMTGR